MENRDNTVHILQRYIKRTEKKDQSLFLYVVYHSEEVRKWLTGQLTSLFTGSFSFSSIDCQKKALIFPAQHLIREAKKKTPSFVSLT